MILFTRLNGGAIAINPDLIERVEETPDTVVTLRDDKKFLVAESLREVITLIADYRAYVVARAENLEIVDHPQPTLHLVPTETVAPLGVDPNALDDADIVDHLAYVDAQGDGPDGAHLTYPTPHEGR